MITEMKCCCWHIYMCKDKKARQNNKNLLGLRLLAAEATSLHEGFLMSLFLYAGSVKSYRQSCSRTYTGFSELIASHPLSVIGLWTTKCIQLTLRCNILGFYWLHFLIGRAAYPKNGKRYIRTRRGACSDRVRLSGYSGSHVLIPMDERTRHACWVEMGRYANFTIRPKPNIWWTLPKPKPKLRPNTFSLFLLISE
jgi:hypothetical protein